MSKKPKFIVILLESHTNSLMSNGLSFLDDVYTFSYDITYFYLVSFVCLFVLGFLSGFDVCMNKDENPFAGREEWWREISHTHWEYV